jgi:hypothetical protein
VAYDDVVVQGFTRSDRELLDAQALVGELVPSGSVFAFLAEHRHELFPDSFIADLFCSSTGRPSLPADLIGSVLVLKELYDLADLVRPVHAGVLAQADRRLRSSGSGV